MDSLLSFEVRVAVARVLMAVAALLLLWLAQRLLTFVLLPRIRRVSKRIGAADEIIDALMLPYRLLVFTLAIALIAILLSETVATPVTHLIRSLIIIALFAALYRLVTVIMRSTVLFFRLTGTEINSQLLPYFRVVLQAGLVILAALILLQEWEYDVAGLIAGLGIGGLVVALAAQDTIANVFGFVTIVGDSPFVVGDVIKTEDVQGTVESISIRSTRIRHSDNALITIPNSKLAGSVIANLSRQKKRRLEIAVTLDHLTRSDQIDTLIRRLKDLLRSHNLVEPATAAVAVDIGQYGLEVKITGYILLTDYQAFMQEQQAILLATLDIIRELELSFATPAQNGD